ncbi:MAG TPA: PAS domain S-box protein [Acidimicrobiales bacterium]|nr:PAS domain S-box protein [Acidimicrobiales bacterium]
MARGETTADGDAYQVVFEHAPDAVLIVDGHGRILDANRRSEALFGYRRERLLGMRVEQLMPEEARAVHVAHRAGYAAHPRVRPMGAGLELTGLRADGTQVPVDISLSPLPGARYAAAIRDVTARRAADDELRRARARAERTAAALLVANEELRLRAAVAEHLAEGVALVRAGDGTIVYANDRWDALFGYEPGELIGRRMGVLTASEELSFLDPPGDGPAAPAPGGTWRGEVENVRRDGTHWWALATVSSFVHPVHGQVWIVVHEDVTGRRLAVQAAEQSEARFRSVFDASPIGMAVVDASCRFLSANGALCDLLGYSAAELAERTFADVTPGEDVHRDVAWTRELLAGKRPSFTLQKRYLARPGRVVWVEVRVARLPATAEPQAVLMVNDITARKQTEADLAHRALHDELTGLPNRALAIERLHQALARAARGPGRVGVLFIDLDHFKAVNDRLGHGAGDDVLREVATRMTSVVRPYDTVARLGGDEFVVVCDGLPADPQEAAARMTGLAERLRAAVAEPLAVGQEAVVMTASVGAAATGGGVLTTPLELVGQADRALYAAKEAGRDRAAWAREPSPAQAPARA